MDLKKVYRGEIDGVPVITKFKKVMMELFKGYPAYQYFGIFESYFGKEIGEKIVNELCRDKLLELAPKKENEPIMYRLTKEGINMAISMVNWDNDEETSIYNKRTHKLTILVVILTIISTITGIIQTIPIIAQFIK
ncbi:MAG: hypothetical protein AABX35_02410 [Nanoarchaeota archaeon]